MTKLCKDCKHYREGWLYGECNAVRGKKISKRLDLVTGENTTTLDVQICQFFRDPWKDIGYIPEDLWCGPEGKLWEEKPTTYKSWWKF